MKNPHDQNDTRLITFTADEAGAEWFDKKVEQLKEYDPGFYVQVIEHGDGQYIYKITTHQKNLEHDDAKKFLFQLELRFGSKLKIR